MFEMYQQYADRYDQLVNHEDYAGNLKRFLNDLIDWQGKTVCEFGCGTGRVTKMYAERAASCLLCDNSAQMLEQAARNLSGITRPLNLRELDNRQLDTLSGNFDIVIEGWSFGHLVAAEPERIEYWTDFLVQHCSRLAGQLVIFIETLGTDTEQPKPPGPSLAEFYRLLEASGFVRSELRTDYRFENSRKASEIMGAFFGNTMADSIIARDIKVIPEYTGVWVLDKGR